MHVAVSHRIDVLKISVVRIGIVNVSINFVPTMVQVDDESLVDPKVVKILYKNIPMLVVSLCMVV